MYSKVSIKRPDLLKFLVWNFLKSLLNNQHYLRRIWLYCFIYRKVANSSLSLLVAHFQIFRRLIKEKFDAYLLWPLAIKFQNWIVDWSTARNFTVCTCSHIRITVSIKRRGLDYLKKSLSNNQYYLFLNSRSLTTRSYNRDLRVYRMTEKQIQTFYNA